MLFNRALILVTLLALFAFAVGCGSEEGGVADAPEQPVELTPEEEAGERAYNRSLREN
jgi:hypothetical protein